MQTVVQQFALTINDLGLPAVAANENVLASVMRAAFIVVGAMAVVFLIIGGLRYITSGGDSSQITAAKNTILYAVIGVVVAMAATAIISFVGTTVQGG